MDRVVTIAVPRLIQDINVFAKVRPWFVIPCMELAYSYKRLLFGVLYLFPRCESGLPGS